MNENSYQIDDNIPDTNYFTYQGKNYPIKFDYFKHSSRYFADNRLELKSKKFIQLVDDKIQRENILSEDGIKSFIKYAQHQPIQFTNENIHTLSYLSKKYDVPSLQIQTTKYIADHQNDLLIDILIFNSNEDKSTYEDILADHLLEYIDDERLFQLKIQSIYRIIQRYEENRKLIEKKDDENDEIKPNRIDLIENDERDIIFGFLFKCLDKYGKELRFCFQLLILEAKERNI